VLCAIPISESLGWDGEKPKTIFRDRERSDVTAKKGYLARRKKADFQNQRQVLGAPLSFSLWGGEEEKSDQMIGGKCASTTSGVNLSALGHAGGEEGRATGPVGVCSSRREGPVFLRGGWDDLKYFMQKQRRIWRGGSIPNRQVVSICFRTKVDIKWNEG